MLTLYQNREIKNLVKENENLGSSNVEIFKNTLRHDLFNIGV